MMKLSTMLQVANTVDKEWRSKLAEQILEPWDYDEGSLYALRYSANFIFIFKKNEKTYFLRFNHSSEKDLSSIEAEMNILDELGHTLLNVSKPVSSKNNRKVETVETDLGAFYVVVFEGLPGKQYEIEELTEEQFFTWGSAMGKLHQVIKNMDESICFNRLTWRDHLITIGKMLPDEESVAQKEYEELFAWAETLPVTKENFGLIHYDFELDNLRWDGDNIGMLDFDECAYYWYAADIAFALRDLDSLSFDHPLFQKFIKGYESQTAIDYDLLRQLPMLSRIHELTMFAKLLRAVDLPESKDHPEWLMNLRYKLVQKINNYRNHLKVQQLKGNRNGSKVT